MGMSNDSRNALKDVGGGEAMDSEMVIDARYKSCPGPLMSLIHAVRRAKPGMKIKLLSTDPRAPEDIRKWTTHTGHKFLGSRKVDDHFEIVVEICGKHL